MIHYGGDQSRAVVIDDVSRMRLVVLIKAQGEAAEALQQVTTQVADPEGIAAGKIRCDGGGEFEGRLVPLVKSKSQLTHHTSLKEMYSQSEVPV